uniref:Uncharacterized protein n=1 Tax=uncultured bacterium 213 TaxID=698383 RepID=E3T6X5_9BACT|nr:hypothetical protein [uncultured bacterium 213]
MFAMTAGLMLRRVASAVPDLTLGVSYLTTWISPGAFGARSLHYLTLMALLEFVVIHSAVFMGAVAVGEAPRSTRTALIVGLAVFYSIFVVGFALGLGAWWPVSAFWLLTLNRLTGVLFSTAPSGQEKDAMGRDWATSMALYIGWAFVTVFAPVPRLGITAAVAASNRVPGTGLWIDEPFRLVAFGAAYYLSRGVLELFDPFAPAAASISPVV